MFAKKSFLLATTVLTTVFSLMSHRVLAGSGSISYQLDTVSQFGSPGSGNGELNYPEQLTVGPDGNIYVVERANHRVQIFDKQGNYVSQFGIQGNGTGEFQSPSGIAFTSDGKITVSDANGTSFFDATTHAYINTFTTGDYYLKNNSAKIYAANFGSNTVDVFDNTGTQTGSFSVYTPIDIAVAADGKIYVTSYYGGNVKVYDSSYNFLGDMAPSGTSPGEFNIPYGISIDNRGTIFVTDVSNGIQAFDKNGNYLLTYNVSNLYEGIYADTDGRVYANATFSNQVYIMQMTSTETFSSSPLGGNEVAATALSNLILNGTGTFADSFIGYNNIDVNGNWTLNGSSDYNTLNINNGGTLTVNAPLSGPGVYIFNGGTLSGTSTIHSDFRNQGTISPGANGGTGIGTLTITGELFTTASTANLTIDVNAAGQSDKLVVTDDANIDGSVTVRAASGIYHVNNSYVILTAGNGVNGTFTSVTSDLAFLTPTLDYSNPNQITLLMTRNDGLDPFAPVAVDFTPYAASSNDAAAAAALSAYSANSFNGDTATFDAVQSLSVADAGKLLNEVSPDQVAAMPAVQTAMITSMQTPMFQRLQSAPVSSSDKSGFGFITPDNNSSGISPDQVWLQTIGGVSNQDNSSNGAAGYRLGTVGVRGGADKDIDDKTKLGISAAYAHGTANYKGSNDSSQTQYAHADLYGRHELGTKQTNLVLEGFLGAGGGRIDSTRYITAGTLNNTIIGNTNAYDVSGAVKLSNPIRITNKDIITPNITTAASWTRQNGYTETGSPFALQMNSITSTPVTVTPMVNWQHTIKDEKHGFNLTPDLGIGATWQLSELNNNVNANFANSTTAPSFTTQSVKQDPISLNLSAAVTMQPFTSNKYIPSLTAQATMQSSSTTTNTTGTLTAKWDW